MFIAKENGYLEIIIYIVAMVVGLAANAYRTYSKRKAKNVNPQGESESSLPEILFEPVIAGMPEHEFSEPVILLSSSAVEEGGETVESIPVAKEKDILDRAEMKEGEPAFAETAKLISSYENLDAEMKESFAVGSNAIYDFEFSDSLAEEEEKVNWFDLKEAIIYSEIINPKYTNINY
jgi:hypothetical protein